MKPRPGVWMVRIDDTMVLMLTIEDGERENDFNEVIKHLQRVVPANAGTQPLAIVGSEGLCHNT
jgi:hypothetical protein